MRQPWLQLLLGIPLLYWHLGIETAPALKQAGIEKMAVATEQAEAWRNAGFAPIPLSKTELDAREKLPTPGVVPRADVASPTRSPWLDANGWRFMRDLSGQAAHRYFYDLKTGRASLAAAEAFAYGADAILKIDPADLPELGRMLAFLGRLPQESLAPRADLAVVDDGSSLTGEVMNLLSRRNLLFSVVREPSPQFAINIRIGTKEYPASEAGNPSQFAQKVRAQLTDEKRSLRLYGSEVVICRLTGDGRIARLQLINYGGRELEGLRLRLLGAYSKGEAQSVRYERAELLDFVTASGATEFTIPRMSTYSVVTLH
jgi:hypothetical protein